MKNLLLEKVEFKMETTRFGVWCRFVYPNSAYLAEFKFHSTLEDIHKKAGSADISKGIGHGAKRMASIYKENDLPFSVKVFRYL